MSARDVSDTFKQVLEDEEVSPTTASRTGQRIGDDLDAWRTRSLADYDVPYPFVDRVHLKVHPESTSK